jgi:hypothetical protein
LTVFAAPPKLCAMAYDRFLIDKRVVDRNIAKGLVDPNEYKRIVETLPDTEQNCVHVSLDGDSGASHAREAASASDTSVDDDDVDDLDDEDDEEEDDEEEDDEEEEDKGDQGDEGKQA